MSDKLAIVVLGHRDAGKSETWTTLFGAEVRRGKYTRKLNVGDGECVNVFLVNGSFEERKEDAGDILSNIEHDILLCSVGYVEQCEKTFNYLLENNYCICVQWLNPGCHDDGEVFDRLGLVDKLLHSGAIFSMRSGKEPADSRVQEIVDYISGWARSRGLVYGC